jgi:uncharacterized membrane protein YkoI
MRLTTITAGLVASLAFVAAPLGAAEGDNGSMADKNAKTLSDVPMPVRDSLLKEANGREISKVDRHEDNGKVVYDAKIKRQGTDDLKLKLDPQGSIVWRSDAAGSQSGVSGTAEHAWNETKKGTEKAATATKNAVTGGSLALADLPQPARDTFEREAAGHPISDLDRETKDGKPVYEGDIKLGDGKKRELTVDESGKILKSKEEKDD